MRYLVWDFDGTLAYRVGEWPAWTATLLEVLDRETPGHGSNPEVIRPHMQTGFPWHAPEVQHSHFASADAWWEALEPIFTRAFVAVGVEDSLARTIAKSVRRAYLDSERWRLYEDTVPALEELSSRGWRHLLLTNHVPELPEIIRELGLDDHIDRIFNSADTGCEKPHPKAFRDVLEAVGEAEAVWMIGDNPDADVAGAERAGIPAILVRRYSEEARRYCEDLLQVAEVVNRVTLGDRRGR